MELGIVEIILLTCLANSIFFLLFVLLGAGSRTKANIAVTLFIFLTSVNFASWIAVPQLASKYDWFCLGRFPVLYFLGPLVYSFSKSLFLTGESQKVKWSNYSPGFLDILHATILWVYVYFFAFERKFDILFHVLTLHVYESLAIVFNGYFVYKSIQLFFSKKSTHPRLQHVFLLIVIIFFLWIGNFLADLAVYPDQVPDSMFYPSWIIMTYLNLYLGYHFILRPERRISYLTAGQDHSQKQEDLAERFQKLMDEEKVYRHPSLSLPRLASELGVGTDAISKMLKFHFKTTYYDIINKYRVGDVISRFEKGDNVRYTIHTIAEESGFRSKTTFIKAFKKETGMLPRSYLSSTQQVKGSS